MVETMLYGSYLAWSGVKVVDDLTPQQMMKNEELIGL